MKQYIITNERLNKLMWLCTASAVDDAKKKDIDKQIERLCLDIKNQKAEAKKYELL